MKTTKNKDKDDGTITTATQQNNDDDDDDSIEIEAYLEKELTMKFACCKIQRACMANRCKHACSLDFETSAD